MALLHEEVTEKIIGAFFRIYKILGFGFLERVYEHAFYLELLDTCLKVELQKKINVVYKGNEVGIYYADLVVEDLIIIEVKAVSALLKEHECQLVNYLKATHIEVGLLVNFGNRPEFVRKVFRNG